MNNRKVGGVAKGWLGGEGTGGGEDRPFILGAQFGAQNNSVVVAVAVVVNVFCVVGVVVGSCISDVFVDFVDVLVIVDDVMAVVVLE